PRRAVVFAGAPADAPGRGSPPWLRLLQAAPNLALTFTTGTTLRLRCASSVTATRVAQLLMSSPALPEESIQVAGHAPPQRRRRWHEVLASFLVPGTGQWLQGRFTTGLVLFTAAALLAIFDWWPVAWALHGPKMEVSSLSVVSALASWVLVAVLAATDAWHFSTAHRSR
ncbi:MAG TPA: hypothetical protein VNB23_04725, partial [Ramlibacter sp.]|nr:hypothetical protein [Ramlibacter sp.]